MRMAAYGRTETAVLPDRHHDHRLIRQTVFWFGINRIVGHEHEAPRPVEAVVGENAAERRLLVEVGESSGPRVKPIGGNRALVPTEDLAVGVDAAIALMNREVSRIVDAALFGQPG